MAKQTMTFTAEFEVPEGYELTGEFRVPKKNEWFINWYDRIEKAAHDMDGQRVILRPAPKWRPARIEDLAKITKDKPLKARFRDDTSNEWISGTLAGYWPVSDFPWNRHCGTEFKYCEVLDV